MDSKLFVVFGFLFFVGLSMAKTTDEFSEYNEKTEEIQQDETKEVEKEETSNDEESKMIMEDANAQTSTELVQNDPNDPDFIKHKGLCHWGIAVWFKPGAAVRCGCMKCTCQRGGNWGCAYEFAYCPYYYCGNQIFNPLTQVCCCGKVHTKRAYGSCCGYFYYDRRYNQCCNYYSVKSRKAKCPRHKI